MVQFLQKNLNDRLFKRKDPGKIGQKLLARELLKSLKSALPSLKGFNVNTLKWEQFMTRLTQTVQSRASVASPFIERCATRFSPAEIRQAIAEMVTYNHMDMAHALCEAGLSLYPESEDIVSISALLAELDQDWQTAQQHLEKLLELQGEHSQPLTWRHLIRVVRCQLDPQQALELAKKATSIHPDDGDLRSELNDLLDVSAQVVLSHAAQMSH